MRLAQVARMIAHKPSHLTTLNDLAIHSATRSGAARVGEHFGPPFLAGMF